MLVGTDTIRRRIKAMSVCPLCFPISYAATLITILRYIFFQKVKSKIKYKHHTYYLSKIIRLCYSWPNGLKDLSKFAILF